jgi:hypothetical protein
VFKFGDLVFKFGDLVFKFFISPTNAHKIILDFKLLKQLKSYAAITLNTAITTRTLEPAM